MIASNDPRHGSVAGYVAGCNGRNNGCQPCADAKYRYEKQRELEHLRGQRRLVDSTGTIRRIQALLALGWTYTELGRRAGGFTQDWAAMIIKSSKTNSHTRQRVADLYAELSMTIGPSSQGRTRAQAKGWLPPLAWDDDTIDDPAAQPWRTPSRQRKSRIVDEVLVQRALSGHPVKANSDERRLIIDGWRKAGRSLRELDQVQGWNVQRDLREAS